MESRKVIKFGNSSYVVTLPSEWVSKHKLDKGNSILMRENNDSIMITLGTEKRERQATIDTKDKALKLLNREIISYYLKNYNKIILVGDEVINKLEEIKIIKEKLSSIEITQINKDSIVLEDLTSVEELNVCKLISEIIEMEKIMFDELIKTSSTNQHFLISSLDSNVNKLSFLGYKAINYNLGAFKSPNDLKDTIHYWRIIHSLEITGDKMKRIARYLKERKDSEELVHITKVIENIKEYFSFITELFNLDINMNTNLKLYLDKKQSLLIEFENLREVLSKEITLYLVITQLFKDLLGEMDNIILSVIDLQNNE